MRHEFFVAYDYGMGGGWSVVLADQAEQIGTRFPELKVQQERPAWMTDEIYRSVKASSYFVVDDEDTYPPWIKELIRERNK